MLCLVYLAWTPYGVQCARRFIASYREHPAGTEHRLILALAGPDGDRSPWRRAFADVEHEQLEVGNGIDLDNYRAAVELVTAERYCFVNTVSVVLADSWLRHLEHALLAPTVGMVATTGSFESPNAIRPGPLRRLRPGHEPFPNPHLRTNGFALERELLLTLDWPTGLTKLEAVALEAGSRGLTRQVQARGLQTLVVGRDGIGYPPERWRQSATFRSGEQTNLLVSDNRTRHYQQAGPLTRRGLAWLAWHRWG
ncbi:MAG TPA: hypothetical protein VHS55_05195 [Solirubrobacteraceae bacterium]|jgi:hypothetical protein|nr:hypothetical protein [Solirubrobacteraceae bacterium]